MFKIKTIMFKNETFVKNIFKDNFVNI